MPRQIDADFLKSELIKWRDSDKHRKSRSLVERWVRREGINVLVRVVDVFPSIPYEPVKHGEWETVSGNGIGGTARCSVCGEAIYGYHTMNYCPNCGAKMDGGNNNE